MTGLYWRPGEASLKSFRSTTNSNGASTIVITLAVSDPMQLGHLLADLKDIQREEDAARKKAAKVKKAKAEQLALPKPAGLLTYGSKT
ncbi:hypothetical protein GCM10019059_34660 [Camelimonas fluminis]|uniref:Uncharacterized protein n=1 Tax=Camelimonas fluminis TaxID=1576911 RepID=A0ABV7UHE2_9HYPH|nr:hypothetical protein [Camelimonas fluminis]GHE72135.1 hypothetical protein GCM10019059_34660 [Camelimonas fluminis]